MATSLIVCQPAVAAFQTNAAQERITGVLPPTFRAIPEFSCSAGTQGAHTKIPLLSWSGSSADPPRGQPSSKPG